MPRAVSMRASYGPDAAYLLRLQAAVKKDTRRSAAWTQKVLRALNQVSSLFLQAESDDLGTEPGADTRRRPGRTDRATSNGNV